MIDISDDEESPKKCFKYQEKVIGNLNLVYNSSNTTICLWNKYQIFIHERFNFETAVKTINTEFTSKELVLINNYLICLDKSGNIHVLSLKFKHAAAKNPKISFHLKETNVVIKQLNDELFCLKQESDKFLICIYKIDADFKQIKRLHLTAQDITFHLEKCLLFVYSLTSEEFDTVKDIFEYRGSWKNHYLIILSFDKLTIYGCLLSMQIAEELHLIRLYSCPTEICDVKILYRNTILVTIALSIGTMIQLLLNYEKSCKMVHLNSSIHKFLEINDSIIYSNGISMWRADNIFDDIKFKQFIVKQVKDVIKCGDQIICTTYQNFIYMFSFDDESCYVKSISNDEYCSSEILLNNSDCIRRILEEVKKIETVAKKINEEKIYITTLALSKKQELVDNILQYKIIVFDNYEDILQDDRSFTFADEPKDIFVDETYLILISISTSNWQEHFKDALSNIFGDLRIHITLFSNRMVLKTNTIKVTEHLKKMDIILTIKEKNLDLNQDTLIKIQLVTKIPGVLDQKQHLWCCLHQKSIEITSDHFIKTKKRIKNIYLKQSDSEISNLILEKIKNEFHTLYNIGKITKLALRKWSFYVMLPNNYKEIFQIDDTYKNFPVRKIKYLKEEVLGNLAKSQTTLTLCIGKDEVDLEIINDGFTVPILQVSSTNIKVALDIRNFLSDILYRDCSDLENSLANWSIYTAVETYQREIKKCITSETSLEDFIELHNKFQRNIIAKLPYYMAFYSNLFLLKSNYY